MKSLMRPFVLALAIGPFAVMAAEQIDINTADVATLEKINGIGPAKAKAIVDYRSKNGPFQKIDDLEKVDGIGPKLMEKMKPEVTIKAAATAAKK